jgi:AraC-like DNA-binding protein
MAHERCFREWLGWTLWQQESDLQAHLRTPGTDVHLWLSVDAYKRLPPESALGVEKQLFFCDLEAVLAILRNEYCAFAEPADCRVRQMLRFGTERRGSVRLTLKEFATRVHAAEHHLGRIFRKHTGIPYRSYLRAVRICTAVEFLRNPASRTGEVAAALGYSDVSNSIREFRRVLGVTPREVRMLDGLRRQPGLEAIAPIF